MKPKLELQGIDKHKLTLVNYEICLLSRWSKNYVISEFAARAMRGWRFLNLATKSTSAIKDTMLYVVAVTLEA